jgi:hypothetical protein
MTVEPAATGSGGPSARIDPLRHPAALSNSISRRWRPYRFRAYVLGALAGFLIGGVLAPIATTLVALILSLTASLPASTVPWAEVIWTVVFVIVFARVGSWAIARWLPRDFRAAAETYLWLAMLAEARWRTQLGTTVPRTAPAQRAFLDATPVTPATANELGSIWLALGDLDTARDVYARMPASTPAERHDQAAARWLVDFVGGDDGDLASLDALLAQAGDDEGRLERHVELAVDASRVALAHRGDWVAPMAAVRPSLGDEPSELMWNFAAEPAFRTMLALGTIGVIAFWFFEAIR